LEVKNISYIKNVFCKYKDWINNHSFTFVDFVNIFIIKIDNLPYKNAIGCMLYLYHCD